MPSDITGTEVLEEDQATGEARRSGSSTGPIFANVDPGRRDQPHPAQDAGGPAAGHAGAAGHRRRRDLLARPALLRAGHPEPHRAGRHLSAARGPARPLHVQRATSTTPREEEEISIVARPPSPASQDRRRSLCTADEILQLQELVRRVPVGRPRDRATPCAWCAPRAPATPTRPSSSRSTSLGRRPARRPVPDPGRQGARRAARPLPRLGIEDIRAVAAPCCATASSPTSTPRPRASPPTRSSICCWKAWRSSATGGLHATRWIASSIGARL